VFVRIVRGSLGAFLLAALFLLCQSMPSWAYEARLTAESLEVDEHSGLAVAQGNAVLTHGQVKLLADRIEYHPDRGLVEASSSGGEVTLISQGRRLQGRHLRYNLESRSGVLTGAHGESEGVFVRGSDVEVMTVAEAASRGLTSKRLKRAQGDEQAALWRDVSATTCDQERPHYVLKARELLVIPGRGTVVRRPKVYLGGALLFSYPFDYVLRDRSGRSRQEDSFMPSIKYDSDKGVGIGVSGPLLYEDLRLSLGVIGWTRVDPEGWVDLRWDLWNRGYLFGLLNRVYDSDSKEMLWRPSWGARWTMGQVEGSVTWSQRESYKVEKSLGSTTTYFRYREPEVSLAGPWMRMGDLMGRLSAMYGRYEEGRTSSERASLGSEVLWSQREGVLRPRIYLSHWHHDYSGDGGYQAVTYGEAGLDWRLGSLDMSTVYGRRWVFGGSPMEWDRYSEAESLYQTVGFYLGDPAGDYNWRVSVRWGYDLKASSLAQMLYLVSYKHHCLTWDLMVKDNRSGGDLWFGVNVRLSDAPRSGFQDGTYYEPVVDQADQIYGGLETQSASEGTPEDPFGGGDSSEGK